MTQYVWQLTLNDGEKSLINYLLKKYIEKLNNDKLPICTFERSLKTKLDLLIPN